MSPRSGRLVSLKSGVLVELGLRRVGNALTIGDLLVMHLCDLSSAHEADALPSQIHDDDVLIRMRLLPTVVEGLFFGVFWPLSTPFGTIDDEARLGPGSGLTLAKVVGVRLREDT